MPKAGRIVAVGGHLHGGSHELRLTQPACGNRTIARSDPTYAVAGDPIYRVHPLLHEPDPKSITWTQWSDGWAIGSGERLKVSAVYDDTHPHMRVMGISHVYLAADSSVQRGCAAPPAHGEVLGPGLQGTRRPAERAADARPLARLRRGDADQQAARGASRRRTATRPCVVKNFSFDPPLVSIPRGATVRWSFRDPVIHDATVVRGPRGFATPTVRNRAQSQRFTVPGEYRLYCSIHPVQMSQVVRVR